MIPSVSPRPSPSSYDISSPPDANHVLFKTSLDSTHSSSSLKKSISRRYNKEREDEHIMTHGQSNGHISMSEKQVKLLMNGSGHRPSSRHRNDVRHMIKSEFEALAVKVPNGSHEDSSSLIVSSDPTTTTTAAAVAAAAVLDDDAEAEMKGKMQSATHLQSQSAAPFSIKKAKRKSSSSRGHACSPDSSTDHTKSKALNIRETTGLSSLADPIFSNYQQQQTPTTTTPQGNTVLCQVCTDQAAGFYCSAFVCEACKKFFIRASKLECPRYICQRKKNCEITKESRVHCQYCRYQKCLQLNMCYPKRGQKSSGKSSVKEIPCRVCSAPSSGFHFGVLTCEGCKGFFRRMMKEREAFGYKCSMKSTCEINTLTRNMCKACRFNKCLQIGMSVEGSRIGRQPNAIKHAISLEANKQIALKIDMVDLGDNYSTTTEPPTDFAHQAASAATVFSFNSVVLDTCQSEEVENLKIPHVFCKDIFNSSENTAIVKQEVLSEPDEMTIIDLPYISSKRDSINSGMKSPHNTANASLPPDFIPVPFSHAASLSSSNYNFSHNRSAPFSPQLPCIHTSAENRYLKSPALVSDYLPISVSRQQSMLDLENGFPYTLAPTESSFHPEYRHNTPGVSPPPRHYQQHSRDCHSYQTDSCPSHLTNDNGHLYHCRQTTSSPFEDSTVRDIKPVLYQDPRFQDVPPLASPQLQQVAAVHSNLVSYPSSPCSNHADFYIMHGSKHKYCEVHGVNLSDHKPPLWHQPHHNCCRFIEAHPTTDESISLTCNSSADLKGYSQKLQNVVTLPRPPFAPSGPPRCLSAPSCDHHQTKPDDNKRVHNQQQQLAEPGDLSREKRFVDNVDPHQSNSLHLSHPTLPSNSVGDQRNDESLNLSITKSAPSEVSPTPVKKPRCSDSEMFSKENIEKMMTLAAKEIASICIVERAKSDVFDAEAYSTVEGTWERMMNHFNFHAKFIVRFAKKIPGFRNLYLDDQVSLLRASTYVIVVLNHARSYEPDTEFFNYFNFNKKETEKIREFFPSLDCLPAHFLYACRMSYKCQLTEMEYALLSTLFILNSDTIGITNKKDIVHLKDIYMNFFTEYELNKHTNSAYIDEKLRCLPEFSKFADEHNEAVGKTIETYPQLHIPQLYAEMYK